MTAPEQPGLFIKASDATEIEQLQERYAGFSSAQIENCINLYGPLRANVIFNLERKQKAQIM